MSEVRVGSSKDLVTATDERGMESGYPHTLRPELHKALDAVGIEYWVAQGLTYWNCPDGRGCVAYGYQVNGKPVLAVKIVGITDPEQAIAATLGATDAKPTEAESSGTCRNVAVPDEYSDRPFTCSECGARGPMGNGTYHLASSWSMEDGTLAFADSWPVWKYCPNCGRRVVDPTADGADAEVTDG